MFRGAKEEEERAQIAGDGNQLQKEGDEEAGLDTNTIEGSAVGTLKMGDGKVRSSSNPPPAVAEAVPIDSKNAEKDSKK